MALMPQKRARSAKEGVSVVGLVGGRVGKRRSGDNPRTTKSNRIWARVGGPFFMEKWLC